MANKFYHIGVANSGPPRPVAVDTALTSASIDWIRYSFNTWIVWTPLSAQQIYQQLGNYLTHSEQVFVVGLDIKDRQGMLSQWIWEWIAAKERDSDETLSDIVASGLRNINIFPPNK